MNTLAALLDIVVSRSHPVSPKRILALLEKAAVCPFWKAGSEAS
jgi:hypothetical protein